MVRHRKRRRKTTLESLYILISGTEGVPITSKITDNKQKKPTIKQTKNETKKQTKKQTKNETKKQTKKEIT
jgi:hypothetical protein